MYKSIIVNTFLVIGLVTSCQPTKQKSSNNNSIIEYVDPFIGTGGHGHTYPGATVPFGMIQVSPDNGISAWDWCSGYNYSDSIMAGISHLHLSGTGIGDLNDVLLMPVTSKILFSQGKERDSLPYTSKYSHKKEEASLGYYKVYLEKPKVWVELTAQKRVAHHRYTFQKGDMQSVVLDLGFSINWDKPTNTSIKILDKYTIAGQRFSTGWAKNQKVFFVIKFSKPINKYDFQDKRAINKKDYSTAQLFFDNSKDNELLVKVALSSVSIENAQKNLQTSIENFDNAKAEAEKLWTKNLSNIQVESQVDSLKTIFYTALYHTQIAPVTYSDVNGECRLQNDSIVRNNFTTYSTLSLWDTFRAEKPLLTLIQPKRIVDIIKSMLVYYDEHKALPVWTLYGNETNCMTGYHSVSVIACAYFNGVRGFDVEKAYEAMKATMLLDARGLKSYKKYGYIPYDKLDESVTISLEYAYNDWCVAQMALALNKDADYKMFIKRSNAFKYLFDKKTGFMRGKHSDGKSWRTPFDPKYSNHREKTDYTEGNAWQHSWFVLHNTTDFINLFGSKEAFLQKLEQLFSESSEIVGDNVSADISGLVGQYAHGNEPSHHIPYLFNIAGQPWRTQYWVREILKTQYNATPNGLSGNEDCGQMSAWYVFNSIGLYPFNPASGEYQIGSPIFEKTKLQLPNGKTFTIVAKNVSDKNIYIQSAKLNGKKFNQTNISYQAIIKGGNIEFVMGAKPNKSWGLNK